MNNSIFVIRPYKSNGMWVFDDERVGLDKEPFVAGADTMIGTCILHPARLSSRPLPADRHQA